MAHQLCLPGLEGLQQKTWNPVRHTLEAVRSYFRGFAINQRQIFAKLRYIAGKLGLGISTLKRYLAWMGEHGEIMTTARHSRYAVRTFIGPSSGPSGEPSQGAHPLYDVNSLGTASAERKKPSREGQKPPKKNPHSMNMEEWLAWVEAGTAEYRLRRFGGAA